MKNFKPRKPKVWLDIDGVLADFANACCNRLGIQNNGEWAFYKEAGMTSEEFDNWLIRQSDFFWEYLAPTNHAKKLVELVEKYDPDFDFLTHSMGSPSDIGKVNWIARIFGDEYVNKILIVRSRQEKLDFLEPGDLLIDDSEETCKAARDLGVDAFLWDRNICGDFQLMLVDLNLSLSNLNPANGGIDVDRSAERMRGVMNTMAKEIELCPEDSNYRKLEGHEVIQTGDIWEFSSRLMGYNPVHVHEEDYDAGTTVDEFNSKVSAKYKADVYRKIPEPVKMSDYYLSDMDPEADKSVVVAKATEDPNVFEIRITDPETGGQKNAKPIRMDLIPPDFMTELGKVYHFGAGKYAEHNFRKGYAFSLSMASLMRHWIAWVGGEDDDPESGCSHLAHVAWHCATLIQSQVDFGDRFDDRYKREQGDQDE